MRNFDLTLENKRVHTFDIVSCDVKSPQLPDAFHNYRLVQLSDFHLGAATPLSHIAQAVSIVREIAPDLVLLTGDYLQLERFGWRFLIAHTVDPQGAGWLHHRRRVRKYAVELSETLSSLTPRDGIIGVLGNHEYVEGVGTIIRQLGVRVRWLRNASTTIERQGAHIRLAGIEDLRRGVPDLSLALARELRHTNGLLGAPHELRIPHNPRSECPVSALTILLSHNPDIVLHDPNLLLGGVDLILSGHTHGGQICLPYLGPLLSRTKQRTHVSGLSWHNNTAVYVSRGLGYGMLKLRVCCPPEITVFTLRKS